MVRILTYTPEPLLGTALSDLILSQPDFQLVGTVSQISTLLAQMAKDPPSVALLAMSPELHWGVISEIRSSSPTTKLVFWVNDISTEMAHQALQFGVRGILRRTLPPDMLLKCLRDVSSGELWFEKALTDTFLSADAVRLSKRESQLVELLAKGLKNKEIATVLGISEGTVKVYLSKLYGKVGAKDRLDLALYGMRNLQYGAGLNARATPTRNTIFATRGRSVQALLESVGTVSAA